MYLFSFPVFLAYEYEESKTRLCIYYRKIDAITKIDSVFLPYLDWLFDKLVNAKYFSIPDTESGYQHVLLYPSGTENLVFITNKGLYTCLVPKFGYKIDPAQFARVIRRILDKYNSKFVTIYFYDFVVYSYYCAKHLIHLKIIFNICHKKYLKLKLSKSIFAKSPQLRNQ